LKLYSSFPSSETVSREQVEVPKISPGCQVFDRGRPLKFTSDLCESPNLGDFARLTTLTHSLSVNGDPGSALEALDEGGDADTDKDKVSSGSPASDVEADIGASNARSSPMSWISSCMTSLAPIVSDSSLQTESLGNTTPPAGEGDSLKHISGSSVKLGSLHASGGVQRAAPGSLELVA